MDSVNNDKLDIFRGVSDRYNGLTIDSNVEPCTSDDFSNKLNGKKVLSYQK